jgi:DNA-directed RNA polymerase beta' subunit
MEMNIHLAQSIQARNELKRIANVQYQIVSVKNSSPIIGCQQDTLSGAYMMTQPNVKLMGWEVANLLCNTTSETKMQIEMNKMYTGHEIFSHIIPVGINMLKKSGDKTLLEINNGKLVQGFLDKSALSFAKNSIIHFIWDKFGPSKTRRFIDDSQRLILSYLLMRGQTVGFKDTMVNDTMDKQIKQYISNKVLEAKYNITQYENDTDQLAPSLIESSIASSINLILPNIGQMLMNHFDINNFFWAAAKSGAKGDATNVSQVSGLVGQINVEGGSRLKKNVEGRSLIYFHRDDDTPEARGFVNNSFLSGLRAFEFFANAKAGREGLIDTAIKTAQTGYISRQLIKGLEDLSIRYDGTNRNAKGIIIQTVYGENGINQSTQTELVLNILAMNNNNISEKLGFSSEQIKKLVSNKKLKQSEKELKEFNTNHNLKLQKLRDEMRTIQTLALLNFKTLTEKFVSPVNLFRITQDYSNKKECIELEPMEIVNAIEKFLTDYDNRLITSMKMSDKFMKQDDRRLKFLLEVALNEYLAPVKCIFEYGLSKKEFYTMMDEIKNSFIKSIIEPGEMVGIIAAQSIGEPTQQMSLDPSSKIKLIIKNKKTNNLELYSKEIGPFCDNLINKHQQLTYNTGHIDSVETDLTSLENEYYIVGVSEKEGTKWNKLSHVSRHPVNGMMMTVTTKSGRTATTTMSHSHLIRKNQSVVPIVGSDLKKGMRIPVARHIDNTHSYDTMMIGDTKYELDYLFGWYIGAYLAEGSIANSTISISNISQHFIDNTTLFGKKINATVKIRKYMGEYGPSTSTSFSHKALSKFMLETIGTGSYVKKVPDFAFLAPNEFKAGLIQAYFDGDGNFEIHERNKQIRVCSRSEQLIKDIALMLSYFDMFASTKMTKVKGVNLYNLTMSSRYAIPYKQHIGSLVHKERLENIVNYAMREDAHNLSDDIDKINGLGEVIARCGKVLGMEGQSRTYGRWLKKDAIGRRTLNKYIAIFEAHENVDMIQSELMVLRQAANSDVIWDEIVKIDIFTPEQNAYVYDFTVPGNQTFMIDNGLIVHNTLNTKHSAGAAGKGSANMGVSRIQELVHYSKNIKTPQMTIYFDEPYATDRAKLNKIVSYFKHLSIRQLISSAEVYYDTNSGDMLSKKIKGDNVISPFFVNNMKADISSLPFVFRIKFDIEKMLDKETTLLDIKTKFISHWYKNYTNLKNLKKNEKDVISRISRCAILSNGSMDKEQIIHIRFSMTQFNYTVITEFLRMVFDDITLKGVENIDAIDVSPELRIKFDKETGDVITGKEFVVTTSGINFDKIRMIKGLNMERVKCNDIATTLRLYGIEATRQMLINELTATYESNSASVNNNHLSLLVDQMCHMGEITSIDRHGLSKIDMDPLARASFEMQMDHFVNASIFNEKDTMKSVSSRIAVGRVISGGTGIFDLLLDTKKLESSEYTEDETGGRITFIPLEEEPLFDDIMKYTTGKNNFFIPSKV